MSGLLQISDPHFGTEQPPVVEALVRLAREQAPDVAVLSGDITQRARRAQFGAARTFADRLAPVPVVAVPGNHDVPLFNLLARAFWPYANFRHAFGDDLEPVRSDANWLVVAVKSTRRRRHKDGEVSDEQIERVAERLRRAGEAQVRVVVLHHPIAVFRPQDAPNLLRRRQAAIHRWAEAGADVVMGGHIHLPYVLPLHETEAALPRRLWAVQAGTAVSSRVRHEAGNSVNLLRRVGGRGVRVAVERWDYDVPSQCFRLGTVTELTPSRSPPATAPLDR
ncbi:metallophosphoesterase [Aquincola sp. MAHUQ-54]|uniref:Metallophosphoesterase n=1 Tax=Aquincola agrisoli TaxID=3119538 RepID=A0AAW9QFW5_9BURK